MFLTTNCQALKLVSRKEQLTDKRFSVWNSSVASTHVYPAGFDIGI